jgi:CHAT domain-containing protein
MRASGASGATGATRRHATGSWNLVWGNPDAAIDSLRSAARLDPKNASVQSDLAAALLERAGRAQDPQSILEAYTSADSAVALDPRLPEARFNRALALEWLYLPQDAIAAWSSYLELDDHSPWGDEARVRREELRKAPPSWHSERERLRAAVDAGDEIVIRKVVAQFPWRVREQVRQTMTRWAQAYLAGDSTAGTLRRQATALARELHRTTGDALWDDALPTVADPATDSERDRLATIARALVAYQRGRGYLFDHLVLDSAKYWLDVGHRSLGASGNPVAYWAAFDLALVSYQRHTATADDDALARLRFLLTAMPSEYRALRGFVSRQIGIIEGTRFNYDRAIAALSSAVDEGGVIGEPILDVRARASVARLSAQVRGELTAWQQVYRAFGAARRYPETDQYLQPVFSAAAELSWRRWPAVATLFQERVVRLASASPVSMNDSLLLATALTLQAGLFADEGIFEQARAKLRIVREHVARIASDSIRAVYSADADLVNAEVLLRVRPDSAVRLLKQVVARYTDTKYFLQAGRAALLLANAYAATGAIKSARAAFETALSEMERRRGEIGVLDERARFLDHARPVIDTIVRFLADQGDTVDALDFVERMRARVLLERVSGLSAGAAGSYRSVATVQRTLPQGTSMVSYAVLDHVVLAWLIRRDGVSMYRIPLAVPLADLVDRFTMLIGTRSGDRELRDLAASLHQLLVAPFEVRLEPDSKLVIIPDKRLHFLPFAALFDERRGRFLVQSYEISVSPSVQLFAEAMSRYEALRTRAAPTLLAVGNPSFDPHTYALPSLPGAEREAARIADQYAGARLLVGSHATRRAFLDAAATSNVIHFAGHGVVRPEAPLLSYLVLAADAGEPTGALYAKDLFGITLPRTRLAILSGCRTADGQLSDTEGASSLARAFFAAGVPAVIASLWAVDDGETAEFFAQYHRTLAHGADPTAALRRTQVQWLAKSDKEEGWRSLSTWAAFQLFGATPSAAN